MAVLRGNNDPAAASSPGSDGGWANRWWPHGTSVCKEFLADLERAVPLDVAAGVELSGTPGSCRGDVVGR